MRAPMISSRRRLLVIASAILTLVSTFSTLAIPSLAVAADTPTVSVIAGNGTVGFTGDGGPAVDASIGSISGLTSDSSGNVSILDSRNKRIRSIDSNGIISSVAGSNAICTEVFDVSLPLTSFCPTSGMAAASDGTFYYATSSGVEHALKNGTSYHYAGKYTGFYGPYDDGPKFEERIFPTDVQIDPATGIVYFAQQHAVRMITPDGLIQTVAGTPYVCNSGSADSGNAVGACFWVHHFIVRNGDIWFTESSSWNGPRLRHVHNGTFTTIAGNGSWGEPVLGGSATASPFQDLNAISMATDGAIYLTPMSFGRIWRITPAGIVEYVHEFEGAIHWLTMDQNNNLYVGVNFKHQVMKLSWSRPVTAPNVTSLTIDSAKPGDLLLRRGLQISVQESVVEIDHLEYGWAKDASATEPSTTIQKSATKNAVLFYGEATPDSDWYLLARTVVAGKVVSSWSVPMLVHTPNYPVLIFCCDSITSGHHNDYADNNITTCEDPNYGYASVFAKKWLNIMPPNWRSEGQVINVANSGYAMSDHKHGSYISGTVQRIGKDACKASISYIPQIEAAHILKTSANSWSRMIATGGINGTNWSEVAKSIVTTETLTEQLTGRPITSARCASIVYTTWDGTSSGVLDSVTAGVKGFTSALRAVDPSLRVTWLGYYNAAGTGSNMVVTKPYVPSTCEGAFGIVLEKIHAAIQAGLPNNSEFVPTEPVMHMYSAGIQPLKAIVQLVDGQKNPAGWPHPNEVGSQAMSDLLTP